MFRFDIIPALQKLGPSDAGKLFVAAMLYGRDGKAPVFESPVLEIVWDLIRPAIDADGIKYGEKVLQKRYATFCREEKKNGREPIDFDTWKSSADISRCQPIPGDIQYNTNTIQSNINPIQEQVQSNDGSAAVPPPAPARDSRNLIFLDDRQYGALVADLGEAETKRCIDYLSEYCSMKGKPYKDWDAAIRKASREQWGLSSSPKPGRKGTDFQPDADRIKKSSEWLDSFLAGRESKPK